MDPSGDLGRRIVERRQKLGLSSEQLAARSGVSPTYLHMIETGATSAQPSMACLLRLASGLETTIDAIGGGGHNTGRQDKEVH